jgi:16S rRNA (cytosine1407-C5)-methyltransferase
MNSAFESYYRGIYGARWEALRESLARPSLPVFYTEGLATPYSMDRASVLAALSLRTENAALILDACAAPGGKTLVIASRMGTQTRLLANELSPERRRRLVAVLDGRLHPETRERVKASGFDAAAAAGRNSERERFDAILLDAPCSSERHVIRDEKALAAWTPARPCRLARRQWALLSACFIMLKPGGSLVYATCALNPDENDGVAARLSAKYGAAVMLDPPDFTDGEKTAYGRIILPDRCGGAGPMYVARFRKQQTKAAIPSHRAR